MTRPEEALRRDPWLDRWLATIAGRAGGGPILELGCGSGTDSAVLAAAGHRVVGVDVSPAEVAKARAQVPGAEFHVQDLRDPFPVAPGAVNVILASLSLHYFDWPQTLDLGARIRQALPVGGLLLCRLNSTEDHHHGSSGHPQIAPNYHRVDGEPKRFFDRAAVEALFVVGWKILHLEHLVIDRYAMPKAVWEVVAERAA